MVIHTQEDQVGRKVKRLEARILDLENQTNIKNKELSSAKKLLTEKQQEANGKIMSYMELERRFNNLEKDLVSRDELVKVLQYKLDNETVKTQRRSHSSSGDAASVPQAITELQQKVASLESINKDLTEKIEVAKQAEQAQQTLPEQPIALKAKNAGMELQLLRDELERKDRMIKLRDTQITNLNGAVQRMDARAAARLKAKELNEEIAALKKQLADTTDQMLAAKEESATANKELELTKQNAQTRELTMKTKVQDLEEGQVKQLEKECQKLQNEVTEMREELKCRESEFENITGVCEQLREKLNEQESSGNSKSKELNDTVIKLETMVSELSASKEQLESELKIKTECIVEQEALIEKHRDNVQQSSTDNEGLLQKLDEQSGQLQVLTSENGNLQQSLNDAKSQLNNFEQTIQDLRTNVAAAEDENKRLSEKLDKHTVQANDHNELNARDIAELQLDLDNAQQQLQQAIEAKQAAEQTLEEQCQDADVRSKELTEQLRSVETELKETKSKESTVNQSNEQLHSTIKEQESTISNLKELLDQASNEVDSQTKLANEYHSQLTNGQRENLEAALESAQNEVEGLKVKISDMEGDVRKLEEQKKDMQRDLEESDCLKTSMQTEIDGMQVHINNLQTKAENREEELNEELKRAVSTLQEKETDLQNAQSQIQEQNDRIEQYQAWESSQKNRSIEVGDELKILQDKLADAVKQIDEATAQNEEKQKDIDNLNHQLCQVEAQIDQSKQQIDTLTSEKDELNEKMAAINKKLNHKQDEVDEYVKEVQDDKNYISDLETRLESTKKQAESTQQELADAQSQLEKQQTGLQEANHQYAEQTKTVDNLHGTIESLKAQNQQTCEQLDSVKGDLEQSFSAAQAAQVEHEVTKQELKEIKEKYTLAEESVQFHKSKISSMDNDAADQKENCNKLIKQTELQSREITELTGALTDAQQKQEVAEQAMCSVQQALELKKEECDELKVALEMVQIKVTGLQEELHDAINSNNIGLLNEDEQEIREQLQDAKEEIEDKEDEIMQLKEQLSQLESTVKAGKHQPSDQGEQQVMERGMSCADETCLGTNTDDVKVEQVEGDLEALAEHEAVRRERDELIAQNAALKEQMGAERKKREAGMGRGVQGESGAHEGVSECLKGDEEYGGIEQEVQNLKDQLDTHNDKLNASETTQLERKQLEEQLGVAQQRISELQNELRDANDVIMAKQPGNKTSEENAEISTLESEIQKSMQEKKQLWNNMLQENQHYAQQFSALQQALVSSDMSPQTRKFMGTKRFRAMKARILELEYMVIVLRRKHRAAIGKEEVTPVKDQKSPGTWAPPSQGDDFVQRKLLESYHESGGTSQLINTPSVKNGANNCESNVVNSASKTAPSATKPSNSRLNPTPSNTTDIPTTPLPASLLTPCPSQPPITGSIPELTPLPPQRTPAATTFLQNTPGSAAVRTQMRTSTSMPPVYPYTTTHKPSNPPNNTQTPAKTSNSEQKAEQSAARTRSCAVAGLPTTGSGGEKVTPCGPHRKAPRTRCSSDGALGPMGPVGGLEGEGGAQQVSGMGLTQFVSVISQEDDLREDEVCSAIKPVGVKSKIGGIVEGEREAGGTSAGDVAGAAGAGGGAVAPTGLEEKVEKLLLDDQDEGGEQEQGSE